MPIEINEDLIKQWEPKIHRMLATTSVRGYSKEDLEQELRISILKAAKGFNEDKGVIFHTYLHTAMVNTLRTLIAKAQRQVVTQSIDVEDEETGLKSQKILQALEAPNDSMDNLLVSSVVESYELQDVEKRFLKLRVEGLTMEEISNIIGESAYRIRQGLQNKLGDLHHAKTV